ncbi:roadblock/LC7 domain-containing protein [Streptomyces humi]|uniref:roadblock/LC7 domain-containing protein n=1 Tax=Streptomyces humi TaxID=1428620 RepID=UPI0006287F75|nr:roadblock/LC7 domain-containing protein [Streptomyces humi]
MNDPVQDILVSLRERVMGVSETVLATVDGLVVAADADKTHPESMAALASAALSLGNRLAEQGGTGTLRQLTAQCGAGHVIVTAVGTRALLAVVTDEGIDGLAFDREIPTVVADLKKILANDTA